MERLLWFASVAELAHRVQLAEVLVVQSMLFHMLSLAAAVCVPLYKRYSKMPHVSSSDFNSGSRRGWTVVRHGSSVARLANAYHVTLALKHMIMAHFPLLRW